jgi:hypothetical protein
VRWLDCHVRSATGPTIAAEGELPGDYSCKNLRFSTDIFNTSNLIQRTAAQMHRSLGGYLYHIICTHGEVCQGHATKAEPSE